MALVIVCNSQWDSSSLTCVSIVKSAFVFGSRSAVAVSYKVLQYELKTDFVCLSRLLSLNSYSCHSVCINCLHTSFTVS
jgi:hypothetical protein